ncbi:SgcJ/EcaC family oxidoreductase [Jannaschia sp. S6380]|uniref:SgcJ/EcaC family oxidoreductase n=1 Tax=Jannaschia sp. S6380 TaxID=2926408 RepID=UPI001FF145B9|nr:SgcJ/EcaC family oxidoreductase [Jannaschia sp. S6380]MCK0167889.1 SgcJ/EcaC family oxidoreductase [Jannaschia sp. S6380]
MIVHPEDFVPAFVAAWMARDGTALADLFVADADFVNVVGIWWEDGDAIAKAHSYALESFFARSRLVSGRVKIRVMGDVALIHARMRLSGQLAPDGTEAQARTTILSFVLHRDAECWHAVAAQNTDVVPGAETHLSTDGKLSPRDYRA